MKKRFLIAFLLLSTNFLFGQNLFKPLPKIQPKYSLVRKNGVIYKDVIASAVDSSFNGFRFTGPIVLYALPNSTIFTGIGISFEHDTYTANTGKWYTKWAVTLGGYEGGQFAPDNFSGVTAGGLSVSFFNKLLTIGVLYNLTTKKIQEAEGPAVNLNN